MCLNQSISWWPVPAPLHADVPLIITRYARRFTPIANVLVAHKTRIVPLINISSTILRSFWSNPAWWYATPRKIHLFSDATEVWHAACWRIFCNFNGGVPIFCDRSPDKISVSFFVWQKIIDGLPFEYRPSKSGMCLFKLLSKIYQLELVFPINPIPWTCVVSGTGR